VCFHSSPHFSPLPSLLVFPAQPVAPAAATHGTSVTPRQPFFVTSPNSMAVKTFRHILSRETLAALSRPVTTGCTTSFRAFPPLFHPGSPMVPHSALLFPWLSGLMRMAREPLFRRPLHPSVFRTGTASPACFPPPRICVLMQSPLPLPRSLPHQPTNSSRIPPWCYPCCLCFGHSFSFSGSFLAHASS